MKLNVKAFSLTCGIISGIGFMLTTWWLLARHTPGELTSKFAVFFFGYSFTYIGSFVGLFWAFIYGLILGGIFSLLYNQIIGAKAS
jgi:hypothetical protein